VEFIVIFAVFLLFVIFNLNNKCDINFGFKKINDIPVYITALIAFLAGMLCTLPMFLGLKKKKKSDKSPDKISNADTEKESFADSEHYGID